MEPGDSIRDRKTGEGMMLRCLAPNVETQGEENGREEPNEMTRRWEQEPNRRRGTALLLCLEMEYGAFDMLFTGDLERGGRGKPDRERAAEAGMMC